ncbi:uncharacterized protein LOC143150612 [Ptiloglossa arizonensis]|uniref:uncharacterized protein LOC143150612 n=1 Tax=Ptiloglossa arizonensis TaxID=3350558 RepID=UPI003FA13BA4
MHDSRPPFPTVGGGSSSRGGPRIRVVRARLVVGRRETRIRVATPRQPRPLTHRSRGIDAEERAIYRRRCFANGSLDDAKRRKHRFARSNVLRLRSTPDKLGV